MRRPKEHSYCRALWEQFIEGLCEGDKYKVKIVEKSDSSGRTSEKGRLSINQLRTIYSYGLNKNFGESSKKDNDSVVGRNVPPLHRISSRETRGIKPT